MLLYRFDIKTVSKLKQVAQQEGCYDSIWSDRSIHTKVRIKIIIKATILKIRITVQITKSINYQTTQASSCASNPI